MNELSEHEVELLVDLFDHAADKLRHHEDGELGWDEKDGEVFWEMYRKLNERARELDCWRVR